MQSHMVNAQTSSWTDLMTSSSLMYLRRSMSWGMHGLGAPGLAEEESVGCTDITGDCGTGAGGGGAWTGGGISDIIMSSSTGMGGAAL